MAKSKKQSKTKNEENFFTKFDWGKFVPEKYQTPVLLLLLLVIILIFFSPIFFGNKTIQSGDLVTIKSMRHYIDKDHDGFSLWNPYIFCGMPAYATSTALRWFDFTSVVYSYVSQAYSYFFAHYNAIYTFSFIILGLTGFFLMRRIGAGRFVSFLVAFSMIFSTGILVLFFIGHITKLMSLAVFPFILMILLKFQKKITFLDFLLIILGLHVLVLVAHVQIVFYIVLTTLIYFIYYFAYAYLKKKRDLLKQLGKSVLVMGAAAVIAVLMSYDTYAQLFEYKPYSTRGTQSIVEKEKGDTNKSQSDFYDYATNWSFSPGEVLTFIVPSYYGFGKSTYKGPLSQNREVDVNTYFGQMPFVDVAQYMGIVIFLLGLFTLYVRRKEPFVQFSAIVIVLFLLISFGNTFPVVYDFMYYYFPFFDNFRVPSMILTIIQLFFPILAGLGIIKIISLKDEKDPGLEKFIKNTAIVFTVLFAASLLFNSVLADWFTSRVASAGNKGNQLKPIYDYMSKMFTGDLQIAMALSALTFWLSHLYINSKINRQILVIGLAVLVIFDLVRIGSRGTTFTEEQNVNQLFKTPAYITAIKNQNDKHPHRLLNLKQDGSLGSLNHNSNYHVYFLEEDFYGYSAVKPRSYQDFIDVVGPGNWTMWRMLNVKYLIYGKPIDHPNLELLQSGEKEYLYKNKSALPRAYFVDSVGVKKPIDFLNAVKNDEFDPKQVAFVESDPPQIDKTDSTAYVNMVNYSDGKSIIDVNASGNNLLFFGDTYYPHGWKAYIDYKETKIYKVNHGFMGVVVPDGKHRVEFKFAPTNFFIGKYLSLILNGLLIIGFIVVVSRNKKGKSGAVTETNDSEVKE